MIGPSRRRAAETRRRQGRRRDERKTGAIVAQILCIEDDEDVQHLIGRLLFKEGYEVHYAWNGQEGFEKILSLQPDLALLDLMLPRMNGIDILNKMRTHPAIKDIPVVVITAYGDPAEMLKYAIEKLGAQFYLRKPMNPEELVRCVKQALALFPRQRSAPFMSEPSELRKGCVRADSKVLGVWINDRLVATLSNIEFALLRSLLKSPGPVSKAELFRDLGYEPSQDNAFRQTVHRLREALGPAESHRIRCTPDGFELLG
ncbi:MAG: response regulator transcription factor [Elusimicrobia bacterium]|nr:response regulator transcription factor [Elusimicrobiota bacterium]